VQPVGPDDKVELARGALVEGDVHAVRVLAQGRDGLAEQELGPLAGGVVHDRGEIGPRHLEFGPVRSATSIASPRTSTGFPLERCPSERSTTVGRNPERASQ
jgi:hypothetical protein